MKTNKITELTRRIEGSKALENEFRDDPVKFLKNIDVKEPMKDKAVFLVIVSIVGLVLFMSIALVAYIIIDMDTTSDISNLKIPDFLVAIGSTALGGLVGLLAPSPSSES